jgi:demethylmenaquinone methyltransferase/2-methoxy-6-polyprenyl-1,4-benzoquinol methylase
MLAVAQRRERVRQGRAPAPVPGASLRGRGTVTALCGDALRLPLARESVDAVTICYGLRNLADFRAGLAELWRVLKPSGRLVILDFGKPDHRLWRSLYFAYLRWCVPCFGWLVCRHAAAYAYILESLIHYPAQAGVSALLRDLEAANVHVEHLLGGAMSIHCAEKPA